jgi:hypothetical protein
MPPVSGHPYRNAWAAIATMHGKEAAIAPPLTRYFQMTVTNAPDIDTDACGTFTGEVAGVGTMVDAARQKAKWAIIRTGAPLGIGSAGTFGPAPLSPFLVSGVEVLLLHEATSGHETVVQRRTRTNVAHVVISDLAVAVRNVAQRSGNGTVMVRTDMRAHLNPTRMLAIESSARWLALKMARRCRQCSKPGFGVVDVERGLPCRDCERSAHLIRAEIQGCSACDHRERRREWGPGDRADPAWRSSSNPRPVTIHPGSADHGAL